MVALFGKPTVAYHDKLEIGTVVNSNPNTFTVLYSILGSRMIGMLLCFVIYLYYLKRSIEETFKFTRQNYRQHIKELEKDIDDKRLILLEKSSYQISIIASIIFIYLLLVFLTYSITFIESKYIFLNGLIFISFVMLTFIIPQYVFKGLNYLRNNDIYFVRLFKKALSILFSIKAIFTIVKIIYNGILYNYSINNIFDIIELFLKEFIKF